MTRVDESSSVSSRLSTEEERNSGRMEEDFGEERVPNREGGNVEVSSGVELRRREGEELRFESERNRSM